MNGFPWWGYVILAGLSWGTYVPVIFFGGSELGGKSGSRLAAIVCVGVAYLVLAVVIPGIIFLMNNKDREEVNLTANGIVFASLAGVMGAVGAICVVFASKAAIDEGNDRIPAELKATLNARKEQLKGDLPADEKAAAEAEVASIQTEMDAQRNQFRILIAPLIFSIAPIVNTLLASLWDPKPGKWANFEWNSPHWLFWVGIVLVAVGTGCVLLAKELGEQDRKKAHTVQKVPTPTPPVTAP